jgi:cation transport ATPase
MTYSGHVIEHGSTGLGRWLRGRRLRITLWAAAIEGLLVVLHVLHLWEIIVLAVLAVGFWAYAGRGSRHDIVRESAWILAVSQLLVLVVPLALIFAATFAIVIFALLAAAALVFLFTERRR